MTVPLHNLPRRQRDVLEFIIEVIIEKDESPTIKEISGGTGLKMAHVHQILDALEVKGKISREHHKARSILVL